MDEDEDLDKIQGEYENESDIPTEEEIAEIIKLQTMDHRKRDR